MKNPITTNFYIIGEDVDLRNVRIFLAGLPIDEEENLKLSDVAKELGIEDDKVWDEGYIEGFTIRNRADYIGFDTESPNQPPCPILDAMCKKFPSLRYYFYTQIGDENFTNDRNEKFFKLPQITVYLLYGESDFCSEEFSTIEEALSWINDKTNQNFQTEEDVKQFFATFKTSSDNYSSCTFIHTCYLDDSGHLVCRDRSQTHL